MSRHYAHINAAIRILSDYRGEEPFHLYLKKYFAAHKQFGSRDRRAVTQLCYGYFRLGKLAASSGPTEDILLFGLLMISETVNPILEALKPEWTAVMQLSPAEKWKLATDSEFEMFYPFPDRLSTQIERHTYLESFFRQPDLFIRMRPGNEPVVLAKLRDAGISFQQLTTSCLAFTAGTKLEDKLAIDQEAVIQDYSSQQIADLFPLLPNNDSTPVNVWDCCAASGGKSILLADHFARLKLTVSDIRESILRNLEKRLRSARVRTVQQVRADLTLGLPRLHYAPFDLVLADVPCSGSGTWSRSPEQLLYFREEELQTYIEKQYKIIEQISTSIRPSGYLLYATCSVFAEENERQLNRFVEQLGLRLVTAEYFEGGALRADTLFGALLQRPV